MDYIYTSHFLEHLYIDEAEFLLRECYRVLKIGGILRIVVPDLEFVISLYHLGRKEEFLKFFFSDKNASSFSIHRYMYDFEIVKKMLAEIGFKKIVKCRFREGKIPDLEFLDLREKGNLFVEAEK